MSHQSHPFRPRFLVALILLLGLAACQARTLPGSTDPVSTATPALPSASPTGTFTPTLPPTPSPTPIPVPELGVLKQQYISSGMDKLSSDLWYVAQNRDPLADPQALPQGADWEIILVPGDARLYAFQQTAFPALKLGKPGAKNKLYVLYLYKRGSNLAYPSAPDIAVTQELQIFQEVLVDTGSGPEFLVDLTAWGGEGKLDPADIVNDITANLLALASGRPEDADTNQPAIPAFLDLNTAGQTAATLRAIVGIAVGVDATLPADISIEHRLILLKWSLHSVEWADRLQAANSLAALGGPAAETLLPDLLIEFGAPGTGATDDGLFAAIAKIRPDCLPFALNSNLPRFSSLIDNGLNGSGIDGVASDIQAEVQGLKSAFWCQRALSALLAGQATVHIGVDRAGEAGAAVVPGLAALQNDENAMVRVAASAGLERFIINGHATDQAPLLVGLAQDPDPLARLAFARMQVLNPSSFPDPQEHTKMMIRLLSDPDADVRRAAASWIWWLSNETNLDPNDGAVEPLIKLLADPDPETQQAAARALSQVTGYTSYGTMEEQAKEYQDWWDQNK